MRAKLKKVWLTLIFQIQNGVLWRKKKVFSQTKESGALLIFFSKQRLSHGVHNC